MADPMSNIDSICAAMNLSEEGLIVGDLEDNAVSSIDLSYCLVGRFLTERAIDFVAMKNLMASLWRPVCGQGT